MALHSIYLVASTRILRPRCRGVLSRSGMREREDLDRGAGKYEPVDLRSHTRQIFGDDDAVVGK